MFLTGLNKSKKNGTPHQNGPVVRNGSFINSNNMIVKNIRFLIEFNFFNIGVKYKIKPRIPEYLISRINAAAVFILLVLNEFGSYP